MFHKIAPTVRVWISTDEIELIKIVENSPEGQILRSSLKQEHIATVNRLVSKSVFWRKRIGDDVLYGRKPTYRK
jgi:hypothetical protein